MPFRTQHPQDFNNNLYSVNQTRFESTENNLFYNDPDASINIQQWQDWIKWNGVAVDLDMLDAFGEGSFSSVALVDLWSNQNGSFLFDPTASLLPTLAQIPQEVQRHCAFSLTEAEVKALQDIAMPYQMLADVKLSIPAPPTTMKLSVSPSLTSKPKHCIRKNQKRKSVIDQKATVELLQTQKRGHKVTEKRYRTNLNEKINRLRLGVPTLCKSASDSKYDDEIDDLRGEDGKKIAQQKHGKAEILTRALAYIKHLENTTGRLEDIVASLQVRVEAFEKLAIGGSIASSSEACANEEAVLVKKNTLESIETNFQKIEPGCKSSIISPVT